MCCEIEKSLYFLSLIIPLVTWSYYHNKIAPKHWISVLLFLRYKLHVTRTPGIRCRVRQGGKFLPVPQFDESYRGNPGILLLGSQPAE